MAVGVRMRRMGARNDVSFRIVATDSRSPRDGKYLELLGWYNPKSRGENFNLNLERIDHWLQKGAVISNTVRSLVRKARKKAGHA